MFLAIYLGILFSITSIDCSSMPFIRDATVIPRHQWNSTTVTNHTINQCRCLSVPSFVAFNWYPNNTCQLFYTFPRTYKIQRTLDARLYFSQGIFPKASQCCMLDTNTLVEKLGTADQISVQILQPRCLTFDNHGYLVTVSDTQPTLFRLHSNNLTIVTELQPPIFDQTCNSITYDDEKYFLGFDRFLLILNSNNFTILHNITVSLFNGIRDMGFLNNGQTLLVLSSINQLLLFFNQSNNYSFIAAQLVTYASPHGLHIVNDNFFYVTSWNENSIYSYTKTSSGLFWREQLFINAAPITSRIGGGHLTVDDCNRVWFSLGHNSLKIFNNQGVFLQNLTQITPFIFDTIITDNYVLYISDLVSNRIVRIKPNIEC